MSSLLEPKSSTQYMLSQKATTYINTTELLSFQQASVSENDKQQQQYQYNQTQALELPKKSVKRIAVVGSRAYKNLGVIDEWLNYANKKYHGNIVVVSGGARGVDITAEQWAIKNKVNRDIFIPNWKDEGKKAGILRNKQIVENADFILAFWDGDSSGTEFTLNYAKKLGKPCIIVFEDGFHKKW